MSILRNIIAVFMALTIVSPACCCLSLRQDSAKIKSCCNLIGTSSDSGKKAPDKNQHVCQCASKQVPEPTKDIVVPADLADALLNPQTHFSLPLIFPAPLPITCAMPQTGYEPPGMILAKYSRWII